MYIEQERPSIKIFCAKNFSAAMLRELCSGIEEEGVPFSVEDRDEGKNANSLAWDAAQASRLEVGIGADSKTLVLTQVKLRVESPLLTVPVSPSKADVRALGGSAGRLVKKMPLKIIESGNKVVE